MTKSLLKPQWLLPLALLAGWVSATPHPMLHPRQHHRGQHQNNYQVVTITEGGTPPPPSSTASPPAGASPTGTTGTTTTGGGNGNGGGGLNWPSGCLSKNGYHIGFDFEGTTPDLSSLPAKPCIYGTYVNINQLDAMGDHVTDANAINAIYMISMKPIVTGVDVSAVAQAVNAIANQLNSKTVWLRLGYEMQLGEYPYDSGAFKTLWTGVANAVDRSKVKMYWCPNTGDIGTINSYYPEDASTVDIAGVDTYMQDDSSQYNQGLTSDFCSQYADKPIFVGEAGVKNGGSDAQKENWFQQAISSDISSWCSSYVGFAWFEIVKDEGNFQSIPDGAAVKAIQQAS